MDLKDMECDGLKTKETDKYNSKPEFEDPINTFNMRGVQFKSNWVKWFWKIKMPRWMMYNFTIRINAAKWSHFANLPEIDFFTIGFGLSQNRPFYMLTNGVYFYIRILNFNLALISYGYVDPKLRMDNDSFLSMVTKVE